MTFFLRHVERSRNMDRIITRCDSSTRAFCAATSRSALVPRLENQNFTRDSMTELRFLTCVRNDIKRDTSTPLRSAQYDVIKNASLLPKLLRVGKPRFSISALHLRDTSRLLSVKAIFGANPVYVRGKFARKFLCPQYAPQGVLNKEICEKNRPRLCLGRFVFQIKFSTFFRPIR